MRTIPLPGRPAAAALLGVLLLAASPCTGWPAPVRSADDSGGRTWTSIENDGYELKGHFLDGINHLSTFLDGQIAQLKAKRASMTTDTKDWDMAMKEVLDSRSLLTGRIRDLSKADTPEAWADAKEKAGQAWKRSQEAVDRMGQTVTTG